MVKNEIRMRRKHTKPNTVFAYETNGQIKITIRNSIAASHGIKGGDELELVSGGGNDLILRKVR